MEEQYLKFNLNNYVKVKINADGYTKMQMHDFLDRFANLGFNLPNYVDINLLINIKAD